MWRSHRDPVLAGSCCRSLVKTPLPHHVWPLWAVERRKLKNIFFPGIGKICLSSLGSLRDRLIQFKIVHRAYFTPHRLHKMNPDSPPGCWRCGGTPGDFTHIFWTCPAIVGYWREILDFITQITSVPLQPSMSICILGLTEQLIPTVAGRTLVGLLLFYARKAIALSWRKPTPPSSLPVETIN